MTPSPSTEPTPSVGREMESTPSVKPRKVSTQSTLEKWKALNLLRLQHSRSGPIGARIRNDREPTRKEAKLEKVSGQNKVDPNIEDNQ